MRLRYLVPSIYILFLMLPIYWLLNMSFKTTNEILGHFHAVAQQLHLGQLRDHFHRPDLVQGLHHFAQICGDQYRAFGGGCAAGGLCLFALPVPGRQASVLLALVQPDGAGGGFRAAILSALFRRRAVRHALAVALAHTLFNIPLAVWILEGFMSGVPKELDETAYVDGYSFWRFFFQIFMPTIAAGIGVACFFCFMFSWVELLLAKTLTSVQAKPIAAMMTSTASTSGYQLGLLAAAGTLTLVPGAFVIYFVRNYIAKGFALGRV